MICKCIESGFLYNYSFIDGGKVLLENPHLKNYPILIKVKYEDWVNDYLVIDKWNTI